MKKIVLILCAFVLILPSCNQSGGGSDTEEGFSEVTFDNELSVLSEKSYNFTHASMNYTCGPDPSCVVILLSGTINDSNYTGFAVQYKNPLLPSGQSSHPDYDANSFKFILYWSGSVLTEGTVQKTTAEYTIKIIKPGVVYSTPTGDLNIDIVGHDSDADGSSDYYSMTFNSPLAVQNPNNASDSVTFNSGDSLQGRSYAP